QVHPEMRGRGIEKTDNMRAQQRLRDPLTGERIRGYHRIGSGGKEMFLRAVFAGSGNNLQMWIQPARRKHDIEIRGIGCGRGNQSTGSFDLRLAQSLFLGSVSGQHQPVLRKELLPFAFCVLDDHKWDRLAREFPGHTAADAAHTADDEVALEASDLALHAPPSKKALQLEF